MRPVSFRGAQHNLVCRSSFQGFSRVCLRAKRLVRRPCGTTSPVAATHRYAMCCSCRASHTNTGDFAGCDGAARSEEAQAASDVCLVESLDVFAKSRMLNYLNRHSPGNTTGEGAVAKRASPFIVSRVPDGTNFRAEVLVPVEVFVSGVMCCTNLVATGFARLEKDAIVAACMHAERCLDALGIPLFTSERLQRKRVDEAKREGRYAPLPGDPVRELRPNELPFPLLYKAAAGGEGKFAAGDGSPHPRLRSYQPDYHTTKRRYNDFTRRFGGDPFLRGVAGELAYLQASIFKHNTFVPGMEDDGECDQSPFTIEPAEVELLQPNHLPRSQVVAGELATTLEYSPARLALVNSSPLNEHRIAGFIDESEGNAFDLVEGDKDTWHIHDELPGLACLFDASALRRVDKLYKLHFNAPFESCVTTAASEELTQTDIGFSSNCRKEMTWFTATAPIPLYPTLQAKGKAMSISSATHLCAMHAELILSFLGVPISQDALEQTRHYDACLRHGRIVSPTPRELNDELQAMLPKPLKEWHRIKKTRKRGAPMCLSEKVVALNRRVVADIRQHLMEVDICSEPKYKELLLLCVAAVRQFMVEQGHPYESAYVNFVYSANTQYRCSIYLPLPERYGIRGGVAIATTAENARSLSALHAIDTLCALNIPISRDEKKISKLLEKRKHLGLILPQPYDKGDSAALLYTIRSPPGYRDAPGHASKCIPSHQDVWNLMMANAGDFDVVKDVEPAKCNKLGFPDVGTILRSLFQTYLRTVGWSTCDQWSSMKHYQGMQHWNGKLRLPCNNFWMELPVDKSKYGRRIALGRCVFRKGAEKAFYIHAFRVLFALRLAPWDIYTDSTLAQMLRTDSDINIERQRQWWDFVVQELIQPEGTEGNDVRSQSSSVKEAEVLVSANSADLLSVPSPNPVMMQELAKRTFV